MKAVTIPTHIVSEGAGQLASLVAARLCHDIVSPLGAIGNGVELLEMSGDFAGIAKSPELMLIAESVRSARVRVRFYRVAFGHAPADQRMAWSEIAQLVTDHAAEGRLAVELSGEGDLSRLEARLLLLGLMCMETAMPWGGRILVARTPQGWRLVGEASRTRAEPALWRWLDGTPGVDAPPPAPAEVHFAVLGALAAEAGRPVRWELDDSGAELTL